MRYILVFIISISIFSYSFAEESSEISLLIDKIRTSEASDKHLLINQLKIQLRSMNKENQLKAMQELRKSLNSRTDSSNINIQHKNHRDGFKQHMQSQKQNKQNNSFKHKGNK